MSVGFISLPWTLLNHHILLFLLASLQDNNGKGVDSTSTNSPNSDHRPDTIVVVESGTCCGYSIIQMVHALQRVLIDWQSNHPPSRSDDGLIPDTAAPFSYHHVITVDVHPQFQQVHQVGQIQIFVVIDKTKCFPYPRQGPRPCGLMMMMWLL